MLETKVVDLVILHNEYSLIKQSLDITMPYHYVYVYT